MWKNMLFTITRDFRSFVHEGGWSKLMVDQVDHAPLHNFKDDGSSVFEPISSDGQTSFSKEIPELDEPLDNGPKNVIWEEEDVDKICDNINPLGFNDIILDNSDSDQQDQ
jgi:nucleosome binding factor SPN SPT16 subunit